MTCDDARLLLHEAHDEGATAVRSEALRSHVASCIACREFDNDLNTLSRALRALPQSQLPADALDRIWTKTSRSRPTPSWMTAGYARLAAAVVVTAVSTAALYYVFAPAAGPSAVELAAASAQAELVFGYTAKALAATRNAAANRVLASKVSPAVRGESASDSRRR